MAFKERAVSSFLNMLDKLSEEFGKKNIGQVNLNEADKFSRLAYLSEDLCVCSSLGCRKQEEEKLKELIRNYLMENLPN